MTEKVEILGVRFDNVSLEQARDRALSLISSDNCVHLIVTPNPEMIIRARQEHWFNNFLSRADLSIPDGAGVVIGSRILGQPLRERVAGFDLMQELLSSAEESGFRVYLLGAEPEIIEQSVKNIKEKYRGIYICGFHHGYFDLDDCSEIISEINELKPDILFVGMGVPRQEKFLEDYLDGLKAKLIMTVGGSFDVLAGKVNRAPLWLQKANLEWLYRLYQDPARIKRMAALPKYVFLLLLQALNTLNK